MRDVPNPVRRRDGREEHAQELAEGHADRGNGPGLDDEEQGPAVEKSPQRAQRFAEVHVLSAGARHHGSQLSVGQRAGDGHEPGDDPGGDQQRGRIDQPRDLRRDDEDAGADHGAHDQRGGAGQAEALDPFAFAGADRYRLRFCCQGASCFVDGEMRSCALRIYTKQAQEFLSNFGGGTEQVGDDGYGVGSGVDHRRARWHE